jgi:gluconolactonase
VERIAHGYRLVEAPVAWPGGGLVFSDVLTGGAYRWDPSSGDVSVVVPKRRGIGGMAAADDGGLVVSGRDVSHVAPDGTTTVLFAPEGARGFNDLTVDPEGRVVAGMLRFRPFAGEAPVPGAFLRVDDPLGDGAPAGPATTVVDDVLWANGCATSPDGDTFYGCDYQRGVVLAADRRDDGTYGEARVVVASPSGQVDGMAVDEAGALWVALGASATIGRFRPDGTGTLDGELVVDAEFVASLCFGGDGLRDLFVTTAGGVDPTGGAVFRTRVDVAGLPVPAARVARPST